MASLDMSMFSNEKYIDTLKSYEDKIVNERGTTCEEQEEKLYANFDDRKRILLELGIIKRKLEESASLYMRFSAFYKQILADYMVISLTESIIPKIKQMIVLLDIACGLRVHLYSAIHGLLEKYKEEYTDEYKRACS